MTARYSYFYMPSSHIGMGPKRVRKSRPSRRRRGPIRSPAWRHRELLRARRRLVGGAPRRHGIDVKFNKYISRDRVSHNVRFGVQFVGHYTNDRVVYSGGVRYTDVTGGADQAEFRPSAVRIRAKTKSQRSGPR